MSGVNWNPWKIATIGLLLVIGTALTTGVVVAYYAGSSKTEPEQSAPAPEPAPPQPGMPAPPQAAVPPPPPAEPPMAYARSEPSRADIKACNRYAQNVAHQKTQETLTDGLLGGALGAGLGAAGGAIAGGGGGAGKGAGIGALVGAAGGTLYGLNQANQSDARVAQAYRACMKRRGYSD